MKNFNKGNRWYSDKAAVFLKYAYNSKIVRLLAGAAIGAVLGELYWEFIGCNSGSCPLTSSQLKTILFFTVMGGWFTYRK